MEKVVSLLVSFGILFNSTGIRAGNLSSGGEAPMNENFAYEKAYSSTYTEVTTLNGESGRDGWRDGLVAGNGENGVIESCGAATDIMIFQNMKFGYPTNAVRMTPDMSEAREAAKQNIFEYNGEYLSADGAQAASDAMISAASKWVREMNLAEKWELQHTYAFHPAHQLRLQMDGVNGEETAYRRYTDYAAAEIGTEWTDKNGVSYERKTFSSREDNVNITSLKSVNGGKISLTISVDDIARMSNEGGVGTKLADLRYRKVVDRKKADYIGISAHYPFYGNSDFNEAGFGGITRIIIKGGSKKYVFGSEIADDFANPNGGATDAEMNLGHDKSPSIEISGAEEVFLITKTAMGFDIGTLGEFEESDELPKYINNLIADTAEVAEKYGGKSFDYEKALAPSAEKHGEIMGRLTYSVCTSPEDIAMRSFTNEELIAAQRQSSEKLLPAMLERLYYNGRYAAVCSSGIQAPRLGGMWTGAWGCAWSGDYTTDANINLQIAGANLGSLQEETVGFMNVMLKNITDWQLNAKQVYGIDDALLAPPRTDGHTAVLNHFGSWPGEMWISGAAWLIYPMYEYYQCFGNQNIPLTEDIRRELEFTGNLYEGCTETLDKYGTKGEYHDYNIRNNKTGERVIYNLRNTLALSGERAEEILSQGYFDLEKDILYPIVTKTAKFYIDFVDPRYYVKDGVVCHDEEHAAMADGEGWYIAPSYSPENTAKNTEKAYTANSAMDGAASRNIMEIAKELENKLRYDGAEERLSQYEYYSAHIPEYLYEESGELKEWTLYGYTENYGHRHGSQLYGLWPLHEAETDAKLFAGAKKLIETKNSVPTGDGRSGHGWLHRALTMTRLKDGGGVSDTLLPLVSNKMIYTSMMMSHNNDGTSAYCTDPVITIPAVELESLVYSSPDTLELLPAIPTELKNGGELSGSVGVSLRSGGKLSRLRWDGKTVKAGISNSDGVKLKLNAVFDSLKINGTDVTDKIRTDEAGGSFYLIDTDEEITAEFKLTPIESIEISAACSRLHKGESLPLSAPSRRREATGAIPRYIPRI